MKIRYLVSINSVCCGLSLILFPRASHAANLVTIVTQGSGATAGWNAASLWKTNLSDSVFGGGPPVAGNTYATTNNGTAIASGGNSTTLRNPFIVGQAAIQTFPGDSLTVHTNSQIRFKQTGAPTVVPVCDFPGVGGNPGLVLNGGMLNTGDDATYPVTGKIRVDSQSYLCGGNNSGGGPTTGGRAFNISAQISGSGNLMFLAAGIARTQIISGTNDTYTGTWIIKSAWVQFNGGRALGTNSSVLLDPNYPNAPEWNANFVDTAGPAQLELGTDFSSAGTLTLINGGQMRLHQNVAFTAVTIDGTPLSAGTHFYAELRANYPNNFLAGGSGAITVQSYGPLPSLGPSIIVQPTPQKLYAGKTAHFPVTASGNGGPVLTYGWRKGGTPLADGGNISGSTNATLTITNVSGADVADYDVVVYNGLGYATSSVAGLTIVAPGGEVYEAAVIAANPVAFYQLNETGDPATNNTLAFDFMGGYNGTYGIAVQNGNALYNIAGPTTGAGYSGFAGGNAAAQTLNLTATARIPVVPWNLNTNTVTITAWINPSGPQNPFNALVFCRGGGTVAGLGYLGFTDINGNSTLGYHWNDEFETRNWNTGLAAPPGQWSFVALVVTPTRATIHVMNTNGLLSAWQEHTHVVQSFSGTTLIGDDSAGANGARVFNGTMDAVAIFNRALTKTELVTLYTNASGVSAYAPIIAAQPAGQTPYVGQTAQFNVVGGGTDPLAYQWRSGPAGGPYANVVDGGRVSGATTPTLTIANVSSTDAPEYLVTLTNPSGSVTSIVATLSVQPVGPPENITLAYQQVTAPTAENWDVRSATNDWSDFLAASVSVAAKPGSTYKLLAGARLRTPEGPTITNFPGDVLTLDGNGGWVRDPGAGALISEIRFKQPTYGTVNGRVNFKRLVMNGGQLDSGNANIIAIGGRIDVLTNCPINNDNTGDRGYLIDAWLTGTGNIEFHGYNQTAFQPTYTRPLNIAGTSNTFSGKWTVFEGVLLGSGANSLGTNDIEIRANGALETSYDVNNPDGNLFLTGKMFLHQTNTFRSVFVAGLPLSPGTYTAAQLAASYPTNFPSTWTQQAGSTVSNASGSITVLVTPAPIIVQPPVSISRYPTEAAGFTVAAQGTPPLLYQWRKNGTNITDGVTPWGSVISGATTTNLTIANVTNADGADYRVVVTNSLGSVTSAVATLTINPVGPPENITMSVQQAQDINWNNGPADWSDGLPVATSALSKPGSTYEILAGARMRTPHTSTDTNFPGVQVTVDGDGVYANGGTPTIGEIRFKHPAPSGRVFFKKLVMNGGQLDTGDDGVTIIDGRMDIVANSALYNDSNTADRGYRIDAWLTGTGDMEYHGYNQAVFNAAYTYPFNIAGTSNTFSGKWNVVIGVLLGTGANSLGTNNITIEEFEGALETTYDLNNPKGNLVLDGKMFLHQNDTFHAVTVAGNVLAPGTYSFATLNSTYPANFPTSWTPQIGSSFSTGSGSISVLGDTVPRPTMQFQFAGGQLTLNWTGSFWLVEANEVTGPWVTNAAATPPFPVTPTGPRKFYGLQPK